MTTPPQPSESQPEQEEWGKEFDDEFTYTDENGDQYLLGGFDTIENRHTDRIPEIKSFISAQRQQAAEEATQKERERIKEKLGLWMRKCDENSPNLGQYNRGKNDFRVALLFCIDEIRSKIKNG